MDNDLRSQTEENKTQALIKELEKTLSDSKENQDDVLQTNRKLELLEQVVANANDGIIITKADVANPYITYVNEGFTRITGYTAEEVVGKTPRILQGEKTDRETLNKLRLCLESGKPFKGEIINYGKSGNEYWLDISIVPLRDEKGNITHFAAIERDINDRKKAEKELLVAKINAEEANKAKSEFLANMSHELRTPMNGVIGMCELLLDSKLNDEQSELAKTLRASGENLLSLLNDILDISKVEAGDLKLEDVPFDLSVAIQEIIQLFTPLAVDKKLYLDLKIAENIPQIVMGDPGRIQQILRNLITNALKFTEKGGITVNVAVANKDIYIQVKDTGIGVPENKLDYIFEKFTQADTSVTRKYGGTGLGLAITKQLVEAMKGLIAVESTVGYGSIFYFCIPLRVAPEGSIAVNIISEERQKIKAGYIGKLKVLAVDDHPINTMFIKKLLNKMGVEDIDFAKDGVEALFKINKNKYDLVFMDCQMPEMDGYEATGIIREEQSGSNEHLPIIAMTANAMLGDREKCLKAGMDDYISKPVKADILRKVLEKWSDVSALNPNFCVMNDNREQKTMEKPPIDLEHLRTYTDGIASEELELFSVFKTISQENIKSLENALIHSDNSGWKKASHKIKGASANLGATKLAELARTGELEYEKDTKSKDELLAKIKSEMEKVFEFMSSLYPNEKSAVAG